MHPHSKINKIIWFFIIALIVGIGFLLYKPQVANSPQAQVSEEIVWETPVIVDGKMAYENYLYNFRFEHPASLYLKEREDNSGEKSQLSLILVEATKENMDLIKGISNDVREGPISITLDVYSNPQKLSPTEWARQDTNWNIGSKKTTIVKVGSLSGVAYTWSGLYEGKSVLITKGEEVYVFNLTWMTPEDKLIKDFDVVLNSFSFTK